MATAEVHAGACGFTTLVKTTLEGRVCKIALQSDCEAIRRLGEALTEVNPFQEISFRRQTPQALEMGAKYCTHAACPVPVGIIKAVEVASHLALPVNVTINISRSESD